MISRRLTFSIILFASGCLSYTFVWGQQNLFNVPSSDITEPGEIFYQQQFNALPGILQINTTLCYGLGSNFEVGVNVIGLNINTASASPFIISNGDIDDPPVYPFYTINFQKAFVLNKTLRASIGTQTGLSIDAHFGNYTYGNFITSIPRWHSKIITGFYASTNSFLGPGDRNLFVPDANVGFQLGLEQPIIKEKLYLNIEGITGKHTLGSTTLGGAWYFSKHWVLSLGYLFANSGSLAINSFITEFTYVPSIGGHRKILGHILK
ncbi:MAG TPA: hypothetical protein PLR06_06805 [Cyclobacteriaceae bacterium]|nr:hypothetical protein [Cyclobacteriaceae bacterium]